MSKELPYFKFEPAEYMAGNIQLCTLSAQGLFMNVCALYWLRNCELKYTQLARRYDQSLLVELLEEEVLVYEESSDKIVIDFLDIQHLELTARKKRLSDAGKKGQQIKQANAKIKPPLSEVKAPLKQLEEKRIEEKRIEEKRIEIKKEIDYSNEVVECYKTIVKFFPLHLQPTTVTIKKNWFDTIEKLNRIDSVPFELIIDVVKRARKDPFWSKTFLSITKLRKTNPEGIKYIIVLNEQTKNETNKQGNFGTEERQDSNREAVDRLTKKYEERKGGA